MIVLTVVPSVVLYNDNFFFFPFFSRTSLTLRILDIHDFISDMVLLHTKNKAVSLKVAHSVVHVYKDEVMSIPQKRQFLANFRFIYI